MLICVLKHNVFGLTNVRFCLVDLSFFFFSIWDRLSCSFLNQMCAATAKSLQSCSTLCDPIDGSHQTRVPRPWDSPGKNTGVGCHFLLQCMKVKSESDVAQSCPTLSDPMECSLPGSSVHGIFQQSPPFAGIFLTQGWNAGLPHCRRILFQLRYKGNPISIKPQWAFPSEDRMADQTQLSTETRQIFHYPRPEPRPCNTGNGFFSFFLLLIRVSLVAQRACFQCGRPRLSSWGRFS